MRHFAGYCGTPAGPCPYCGATLWHVADDPDRPSWTECGGIGEGSCLQMATGVKAIADATSGQAIAILRGNEWLDPFGGVFSEAETELFHEIADTGVTLRGLACTFLK